MALSICKEKCEYSVDKVNISYLYYSQIYTESSQLQIMKNTARDFRFFFPLKHKVVRDLKIVTEQVGNLVVEGVGYFNPSASRLDIFDRYTVDIDAVRWNGTNIKEVLEVTGGMDEIIEASIRYFAHDFENGIGQAA